MSDSFETPRFVDLKLVETQEPENSLKDNKDKKESSRKEPPTPQKKTPYLRLVSSNPPPSLSAPKKKFSQTLDPNTGFTFKIEQKSPSQYVFVACDPFHRLDDFELVLTLQNDVDEDDLEFDENGFIPEDQETYVVCRFPDIAVEKLCELVYGDETVYAMIMINFQMKVLRELLLFCSEQDILKLVITVDEDPIEGHAWGAYDTVAQFQDRIPTKTGMQVNLTICSTPNIYDRLIDLIDNTKHESHQILWKEHRDNFAMREYLKLNPTLKHFD